MKSNYKRLGDYIEPCDVLNDDLSLSLLQGISNEKYFQNCKSNTVDIDLSRYRVCKKGWFAYNRATTRNGDKISIAYREEEDCLVSPSYKCFKISNEQQLLPYYLLLWFKRPEFDRYARFMSHGSAHEYFEYEQLCEVKLPVPPIEEQQKIVDAYQKIEHRIALKKKINENLEATVQAIYNKIFVEDIDYSTLPAGWHFFFFFDVAELSAGGDRPLVFSNVQTEACSIQIFSNGVENEGLYGFTDRAKIYRESVTMSARGTVGYVFLRDKPYVPIVRLISVVPNTNYVTAKYLYFVLRSIDLHSTGTSQQQITVPDLSKKQILIPCKTVMKEFMSKIDPLFTSIKQNKDEIKTLFDMQSNYLTVLSR